MLLLPTLILHLLTAYQHEADLYKILNCLPQDSREPTQPKKCNSPTKTVAGQIMMVEYRLTNLFVNCYTSKPSKSESTCSKCSLESPPPESVTLHLH